MSRGASPLAFACTSAILLGYTFAAWDRETVAIPNDLQHVHGTVERVYVTLAQGKYDASRFHLALVDDVGRDRTLEQRYAVLNHAPGLMELHGGDKVSALVEIRDTTSLWELKRDDGAEILSTEVVLDLTRDLVVGSNEQLTRMRVLALGIFLIAVFFRVRNGAWTSQGVQDPNY